ncbi:MAG: hypothetical protein ACR2QC_04075 [Gammaproteobacteria bacterium]
MSTKQGMEVKKDGLRQTQDGLWKLTVTVHPNDMETSLLEAPMGTRYMMAMVQIGDDERPVKPQKPKLRDLPRSRQMQKMCGVSEFQQFVGDLVYADPGASFIADDEYEATKWRVKQHLDIESSSELDTIREASLDWDVFLTEYEQATGRMAEQIK